MTPETDQLIVEDRGFVRLLRLHRPDRKNALTAELGWSILRAMEEATADDSVRVIGITGDGDAFCSGADLAGDTTGTEFSMLSPTEQAVDDLGWVGRFLRAIRLDCDKPVVAAVNGVAVGAGLSLALSADLRIAARSARFHPGFIRAGTSPDGGLSWTLPALVGHERAMRFMLSTAPISAVEANEIGMVGEVVDDDDLNARFGELLDALAALPPLAVRQTKRLLTNASLRVDVDAHLRDEIRYVGRGLSSEDGREAVSAILEKRVANYTGR